MTAGVLASSAPAGVFLKLSVVSYQFPVLTRRIDTGNW
jgi:hypothetical protein